MPQAKPRVAVADTGSGNLRSVEKALARAGAAVIVTSDAATIAGADKVVVPGQGQFGAVVAGLDRDGGALRSPAAAVPDGTYFYFVHSFFAVPSRPEDIALETEHGLTFCSAVARDNVFACQFHPEKSQDAGAALLSAFIAG